MKATKLLFLLALSLILGCTDDELSNQQNQDIPASLRFNFLVNSNDEPLEYPELSGSALPVATYENRSLRTLKIPVVLSARGLDETITATYSVNSGLPDTAYEVQPEELSFTAAQATDTIEVRFNQRWTAGETLDFSLTGVSDPSIQLGALNDATVGDHFEVTLGEVNTTYQLNMSRIDLSGTVGETVDFRVEFPNGYIEDEVDEAAIFSFLNGFEYTLARTGQGSDYISYRLTLNEDLSAADVNFQTIITLQQQPAYNISGNANLLVIKPIQTDRDLATNPASHFYDTSNPFYLVRGENWIDHDNDGACSWRSWTAFAVPVEVAADHPNAILGSDNATPDPADDVYYDAYRIGFSSSLAGRTTNPFNLQRWFANEATDASASPGFNIEAAIEFYPEGGTSTTQGSVAVIPQFLTISNRDGELFELAISGSGSYRQVAETLWEMKFELRVTNDALYGGTVTSEYYIYNDRGYEDPADLPDNSCVEEITL
ncbi:hypothetical protein [Leeuwenhoekiella marinoflava]|uniref:hypothetical protein n=1 Tax=Leeuwenhoekiella marinoflava TaxID=988 RepID=UPI0030030A62